MSSSNHIETHLSSTDQDEHEDEYRTRVRVSPELWDLEITVRQLRVIAVAVALVPLSCFCVVAGIWTTSGASVVLTRSNLLLYEGNSSTIFLTLCCICHFPSTSLVDCRISSDSDTADDQLDADNLVRNVWRNLSSCFGCREVTFTHYASVINAKSINCSTVSTSCNVDVNCSVVGNSSFTAFTRGKISSSSATAWLVSGLTILVAVAVIGLACFVSAASRYHSGRLRIAVSETRGALARRRSAAVDQWRCYHLLTDMLPPGVAERLKMGQTVDPETFEVASIYFSDIVGFNDVALSCESPLVIVRLLNSVFRYRSCASSVLYEDYKQ